MTQCQAAADFQVVIMSYACANTRRYHTPKKKFKMSALLRLALEAGACPDERSTRGSTILMCGSKEGDVDLMKTMISFNADIDLVDNTGMSAIMCAVLAEKRESVRFLLDLDADVLQKTHSGHTALTIAKQCEFRDLVSLIKPKLAEQIAKAIKEGPRKIDHSKGYGVQPCLWAKTTKIKKASSTCSLHAATATAISCVNTSNS